LASSVAAVNVLFAPSVVFFAASTALTMFFEIFRAALSGFGGVTGDLVSRRGHGGLGIVLDGLEAWSRLNSASWSWAKSLWRTDERRAPPPPSRRGNARSIFPYRLNGQ
jgi:hypothetical protein